MFRINHIYISIILLLSFGCKKGADKISTQIQDDEINWIYQIDSLLMPFWMTEDAYGVPPGNFPNYRYNNGKVITYEDFDFSIIPEELAEFLIIQPDSLRRSYIRMNSRQVYAYCVAYHMTGNEDYLTRAKMGVDYLLKEGNYDSGSPYAYWQNGKGMPQKFQSTSQDLGYSLTGPTMYYYLTRDNEVLDKILKVKNFVLKEYYYDSNVEEKTKLVAWVKEDFENDFITDKKLLAVLDQLNAYLLLLSSIIPENMAGSITDDIRNLAYSLKDNFYSSEHNLFWGDLNNKKINESPTDFGHSIKSFWMLYVSAKILNDKNLEIFASSNARKLLKIAFLEDTKTWAERYQDTTYNLAKNKVWWSYAELDQVTATLSFQDTTLYTKYLKPTYKYWQEKMIDHNNKEVHFLLDEGGNPIDLGLKTCHWKNGFHSMEHALIGYLSTKNYHNRPINLFYAFKKGKTPDDNKIQPYYYNADIINKSIAKFNDTLFNGLDKVKITFDNVQ